MVPLAGQESASLEPGVAQTGGDAGALKRRRHKDRGGTLVSTAVAATAFGVNIRTVERWVESGKLQPSNWLDGRVAVFHREEIEALAKEYREYVALREQISSAVGAGDANVRIEASKALKRLLKRYKRKRKTRSGE
jgi:tRNA isopentenyl-2-thiomethyl-A-37 hydroxylase MiaE